MSSSSEYLLRLRKERQERERRAQSAAQQIRRLEQDREQQRERELRNQAERVRFLEEWRSRRDREQQQQSSAEEQRRALLAQIQEQRRDERRQEAQRAQQQQQLRATLLKAQSRQALEQRQVEGSPSERPPLPERSPQPNPRAEALRAARAEELRKRQQAESLRQAALDRLREEQRQQQVEAGAATQRTQKLRQRAIEARPAMPAVRPMARISRPPARATETRPSSAATPPIPEEVPLSWLSTQDSFIVDENTNPVYLRGVTIEGLDTVSPAPSQTMPDALAMDDANISVLQDVWGINLIRIPFFSSSILHGNAALSAGDLVSGLDDVIAEAAAAGFYVLLALKPASGNTGLPSDDDYLCWRALAIRYRDEPTVLYELFASESPLPANWLGIAQAVIGTIRREHTASLLFLGNKNATADVSGFPMRFTTGDPIPNLVYTIRLGSQFLNTVNRAQLEALAQSYPVFVSRWSDSGGDFGRSAELAADLIERYAIGWAAGGWNAEPRIVPNAAAHQFTPTRWGLAVQRALAQPVKPLLVAFS